ncbi:MAG: carbamoyltransferase HypF [Nitrospinota bacterium]
MKRKQIRVEGTVQGVGFRPFIYKLATSYSLGGFVTNNQEGVTIEVESSSEAIDQFERDLKLLAPPLAHILHYKSEEISPKDEKQFLIIKSEDQGNHKITIPPDATICKDCIAELSDPLNRRYGHPFISCVNCGPRFSIVTRLPYDRINTTLAEFPLCYECEIEYNDSLNRRFHAQPISCHNCGPKLTFRDNNFQEIESQNPLNLAIDKLAEGKIVAIKGIGGYHLACDAENVDAVTLLRNRKERDKRPFALMVNSLEEVSKIAVIDKVATNLLTSVASPITLLRKNSKLADTFDHIASDTDYLGIMIPYTPLHYLLFASKRFRTLVMTSGNISDEPLVYEDDDAKAKLSKVAGYFLTHNRKIFTPVDDSIEKITNAGPMILRRARGYTPLPIKLDKSYPTTLGVGAETKNCFCVIKDNYAYLGPHIGDLQSQTVYSSFQSRIEHFLKIIDVTKIEAVGHDLHPNYLSTAYAKNLDHRSQLIVGVQHHHAHMVALMTEKGVTDRSIGVMFDGTGYGLDSTIWGGEFLVGDAKSFERKGFVKGLKLPGGEKAIKEPYRIGLYILGQLFDGKRVDLPIDWYKNLPEQSRKIIYQMGKKNINSPISHGVGRYFDAVSTLLGLGSSSHYEGQLAIKLEKIVDSEITNSYNYDIDGPNCSLCLNFDRMFREIISDICEGLPKSEIAAKFHNSIIKGSAELVGILRDEMNINRIFLSGGLFQNSIIVDKLQKCLTDQGYKVYSNSRTPPNDGSIALGQAIIAANRLI